MTWHPAREPSGAAGSARTSGPPTRHAARRSASRRVPRSANVRASAVGSSRRHRSSTRVLGERQRLHERCVARRVHDGGRDLFLAAISALAPPAPCPAGRAAGAARLPTSGERGRRHGKDAVDLRGQLPALGGQHDDLDPPVVRAPTPPGQAPASRSSTNAVMYEGSHPMPRAISPIETPSAWHRRISVLITPGESFVRVPARPSARRARPRRRCGAGARMRPRPVPCTRLSHHRKSLTTPYL